MGRKLQQMCIVIVALLLCIASAIDECITPRFLRGKCVKFDDCPAHIEIVSELSRTSRTSSYIEDSKCQGSSNSNTCCLYPKVKFDPPPPSAKILPEGSECEVLPNFRMMRGDTVEFDEYPWLALIEYKTKRNTTSTNCAGALISSQYVLTAGQCVYGDVYYMKGSPTHVRLGEHDKSTNPDCIRVDNEDLYCNDVYVSIPIENIIVHPNLNRIPDEFSPNNLAIIRMSRKAPNTDFIKPICLPKRDVTVDKTDNKKYFNGIGWGRKFNLRSQFLLPILSQYSCQELYKTFKKNLTQTEICIGGNEYNDSCKIEAGSPIADINENKIELIGIFSFGAPCSKGYPDVFTKVYSHINWIKSQLML